MRYLSLRSLAQPEKLKLTTAVEDNKREHFGRAASDEEPSPYAFVDGPRGGPGAAPDPMTAMDGPATTGGWTTDGAGWTPDESIPFQQVDHINPSGGNDGSGVERQAWDVPMGMVIDTPGGNSAMHHHWTGGFYGKGGTTSDVYGNSSPTFVYGQKDGLYRKGPPPTSQWYAQPRPPRRRSVSVELPQVDVAEPKEYIKEEFGVASPTSSMKPWVLFLVLLVVGLLVEFGSNTITRGIFGVGPHAAYTRVISVLIIVAIVGVSVISIGERR